jgi:hypothetical protein
MKLLAESIVSMLAEVTRQVSHMVMRENPIANFEVFHFSSEFRDDACWLMPKD